MKVLAFFINSPAKMVTVVVPSPTSLSWLFAMSTKILAAACSISKSPKMVAPSFEMVVFLEVVIILSIPLGPRVVLMMSTTASTALMFDMICPIPYIDSVPSLKRRIVGC